VAGGIAYVTSGPLLRAIDVSDPTNPILLSSTVMAATIQGVTVEGRIAYVGAYGYLMVVNVADPASPIIVGGMPTPGSANGCALAGDLLLVADGYEGLTVASTQCASLTSVPPPAASMLRVEAPFPNPFNPRTVIPFVIDRRGPVEVAVYDLAGRRVASLLNRLCEAGRHEVAWYGHDAQGGSAASGVYLVRVKAGGEEASRKLVLLE
jgi:hypothetical protein